MLYFVYIVGGFFMKAELFFDALRGGLAGGSLTQQQVDGINGTLQAIEEYWPDARLEQVAYILATAWHETGQRMHATTVELGSREYIESRYDPVRGSTAWRRDRAVRMGNRCAGDGWRYRGRGPAQLTWRSNYERIGAIMGVDLVDNPMLAATPEYGYAVLVIGMRDGIFTGRSLSSYVNGRKHDYKNARRVINGLDKATKIAAYAATFADYLKGAEYARR